MSGVKLARCTWKDSALGNGELRELSPLCSVLELQEAACTWFQHNRHTRVHFTDCDAGRLCNGRQTTCLASLDAGAPFTAALQIRLQNARLPGTMTCRRAKLSVEKACLAVSANPPPRGLRAGKNILHVNVVVSTHGAVNLKPKPRKLNCENLLTSTVDMPSLECLAWFGIPGFCPLPAGARPLSRQAATAALSKPKQLDYKAICR